MQKFIEQYGLLLVTVIIVIGMIAFGTIFSQQISDLWNGIAGNFVSIIDNHVPN